MLTVMEIKAVSHQLCGTPDYHFAIRDAGIQYLRDHSKEFIESAMLQIHG